MTRIVRACRILACCASIAAGAAVCGTYAAEKCTESLYAPACCQEIHRAGCPNELSAWARVQNPCYYTGYFVGGSAKSRCNMRQCRDQGTWGWDYSGQCFARRVRLDFCCPPPYQSGAGNYKPDGPRFCEELHSE